MRTAFINTLTKLAEKDDRIFLIVGDLGYSVVEGFRQRFPDRFLNAGIAEQNMTGIAAGLAKEGYTVFTYSIGNFPTLRCMEQIRYDVCYHNLNVKVVSVGGGYAYGPLGASHHATEDFGMMRILPGITIASPADAFETEAVLTQLVNSSSPAYLRLGKAGEPLIHSKQVDIAIGNAILLKEGVGTAVLSTGSITSYAFNRINDAYPNYALYSFPYIKPLDYEALTKIANNYKNIITIEEHQLSGGFGSAVLEALNDLENSGALITQPKVRRIGIPDSFTSIVGSQDFLRTKMGLVF